MLFTNIPTNKASTSSKIKREDGLKAMDPIQNPFLSHVTAKQPQQQIKNQLGLSFLE